MKRSTRISLLVFTICAAILAFGSLWYTRPSTPSYIIEEAQQRQNVPLLEVEEPATRLPAPEINYDLLAEKVTPQITNSLLNDEGFINAVVLANQAEIQKAVQDYTDSSLVPTLEDKISDLITDLSKSLSNSLKDDFDSEIRAMNLEIDGKIEDAVETIDLDSYIPQIVDSLTPIVVEQLYNEIELNKGDFTQAVEVESYQLDEEEMKRLYVEYRNQIISDLVPVILDSIEEYIDLILSDSKIESATTTTTETELDTDVEEVISQVVEDIVSETEKAVEVEDTEEEVVSSTEDSESEVASISAVIVAQVPEVSDEIVEEYTTEDGESISIPTFSSTQAQVLSEDDYESLRDLIREQAIQDALDLLSEE
ncbi:MAG: hypothetical protein ACPKM0_10330 [Pleomorphochaeta sp.]